MRGYTALLYCTSYGSRWMPAIEVGAPAVAIDTSLHVGSGHTCGLRVATWCEPLSYKVRGVCWRGVREGFDANPVWGDALGKLEGLHGMERQAEDGVPKRVTWRRTSHRASSGSLHIATLTQLVHRPRRWGRKLQALPFSCQQRRSERRLCRPLKTPQRVLPAQNYTSDCMLWHSSKQ